MKIGDGERVATIILYAIGIALMFMCMAILITSESKSERRALYQDASMCKYTGESQRYCERYAGGKEFCTYENGAMAVSIDCEIIKNLYKPEKEDEKQRD